MSLEIREARPDEYDEAGRVTRQAYEEFFGPGADDEDPDYLRNLGDVAGRADRTTVLLALEHGAILGTVTLELDARVDHDVREELAPDEAHIRMLGVAPTARGRGVGGRLMDDAERRAREAGKTSVTLHSTAPMRTARAMYLARGYVREKDEVLPDGFVLLGFRKRLA
jgi:ribosomal protein S18 acetylase RimI-like enzyme